MGLLDSVLSNPQAKQEMQNYVQRYQQGAPQEGYSDQEVMQPRWPSPMASAKH